MKAGGDVLPRKPPTGGVPTHSSRFAPWRGAEGTIKNHASTIFSKLGVRDRTRAVLKCLELGIICIVRLPSPGCLCKGCGYTEWYARELEEIEPDAARGIHLLDARGPDAGEPFR